MDITAILQPFHFPPLLAAFWYLIAIVALLGIIKSAWFKGKAGELQVNITARLFLDNSRYHVIKNVTLPTEDGTTQIDHVVVSEFGVFVVETKNMKGWIFGSPHQAQWTQKIYWSSHKFQNPLRQNYKHVKTLQALLGLDDNQMQSVVVFVGNSTFKTLCRRTSPMVVISDSSRLTPNESYCPNRFKGPSIKLQKGGWLIPSGRTEPMCAI